VLFFLLQSFYRQTSLTVTNNYLISASTLDLLTVGPIFTRPACRAAIAAIDRYLLPAPDLSSKPAGRRCCCRSMGQTDGETDGRTFDRFMTLAAYYADRIIRHYISYANYEHGFDLSARRQEQAILATRVVSLWIYTMHLWAVSHKQADRSCVVCRRVLSSQRQSTVIIHFSPRIQSTTTRIRLYRAMITRITDCQWRRRRCQTAVKCLLWCQSVIRFSGHCRLPRTRC